MDDERALVRRTGAMPAREHALVIVVGVPVRDPAALVSAAEAAERIEDAPRWAAWRRRAPTVRGTIVDLYA
jgi:hypothetical protein